MIGGYRHTRYAQSFADVADIRSLPFCHGSLLERQIGDTGLHDGTGCYPVFDCQDWQGLPADLEALRTSLVTATVVVSPLAQVEEATLGKCFDVVQPYKAHYLADLRQPLSLPRRHRRNVARALGRVEVAICERPHDRLDTWCALYNGLCKRRGIHGLRAFSRQTFAVQLQVPGLVMFEATIDGVVVGQHLWYVDRDVAYAHLGATSDAGNDACASYALYWHAFQRFRGGVAWLALGGVPDGGADGLAAFKAGWASVDRPAMLCGKVLQPAAYTQLVAGSSSPYFPRYRDAEHTIRARPDNVA